METNRSADLFWKVLSVLLLVVLVGVIAFVYQRNSEPKYIYYESNDSTPKSELAALAPSLAVDHNSIYWVADLAEQALPFVVNIRTTVDMPSTNEDTNEGPMDFFRQWQFSPDGMGDQFNMPQMPENHPPLGGEGSGFVIREDGYIVTNAHVVEGADEFTVTMNDGKEYEAQLVGVDNLKDIAVLKIDAQDLKTAVLGDSDATRVGEPVVAIGSPIGLEATVTAGILSTNSRSMEDLGKQSDIRKPKSYLQTDAAINQGNSGGPLLNADGEVIGVNQAIVRWENNFLSRGQMVPIEGIGLALPINEVKGSIEQIVTEGRVVYPGILAQIVGVQDYLRANEGLELEVDEGVFVQSVTLDGPADKAGIDAGDVILTIDGVKVASGQELIEQINLHTVGDRVLMEIARQGGAKRDEVTVVIGELDISAFRAGE